MAGAFQTSREIFDSPIWKNIVEFRLFFLIYGQAIFSEDGCRMGDIKLTKGQWLRSYRSIQSDLEYIENRSVKKYSLSRIKRAVDNLVKDERIKIEECRLGTLFTVINYSKYQGLENYKFNNENAERTQREQGWNNNNNVKNDKNDSLKDLRIRFDQFWSSYPKKKSKGDALKAWLVIKPSEQLLAEMLTALERAKTSVDWTKDKGQFIPYPATWLRRECWLDEQGVDKPAQKKDKFRGVYMNR